MKPFRSESHEMRFLDTPGCYLTLALHRGIIEGRTGRFVSIVCHQMVHGLFPHRRDIPDDNVNSSEANPLFLLPSSTTTATVDTASL